MNEHEHCFCDDIACMDCYPYPVYIEPEEDHLKGLILDRMLFNAEQDIPVLELPYES